MSQTETFYQGHSFYGGLTWSFVKEQIGQGLRERYELPTELSSKLLALIRKLEAAENKSSPARTLIGTLDAVEGYYLRRYAPPVEPRCISAGSPLLVVLIVIMLIVGSTLSIMNKACKSGYHAWCAPMSTVRHHVKTQPPG